MATMVVQHHKHMKMAMSSHLQHMLCMFSQKRFSSVDLWNEREENEIAVFSYRDTDICNALRC